MEADQPISGETDLLMGKELTCNNYLSVSKLKYTKSLFSVSLKAFEVTLGDYQFLFILSTEPPPRFGLVKS